MFPFHNKLDIMGAKIAQIGVVSVPSYFNQDVSLYIGKNHWLSEIPASRVNVLGI